MFAVEDLQNIHRACRNMHERTQEGQQAVVCIVFKTLEPEAVSNIRMGKITSIRASVCSVEFLSIII